MLSNSSKLARPSASPTSGNDPVAAFLNEAVVVVGLGVVEYWRLLRRHVVLTACLTSSAAALAYLAVQRGWYLDALRASDPVIFTTKGGRWFLNLPDTFHIALLGGGAAALTLIVLGILQRSRRTKYQKLFLTAGLTNGLGDTPVLLGKKRDGGRTHLTFDARGIGLGEFQAKKERLEATFNCFVESMRHAGRQGRVTLVLSEKSLPERVSYVDMLEEKSLPPESFFAGMGAEGPITQKVAELPHLLIAGATGAGKSVFFKQALLGPSGVVAAPANVPD